ncbi:2-hydroxyacylsphingosine 1-beta-galactosyltransferase [Chionoecetes opilio]|uniref:2-hydroxyacylsphingosine 1-beta-galactosyltransferase n=1 Tax=Chionoecetes opilio TaxID=41210 RepID=A0A8J5D656_CHIOP|nr:2-hydroxyacylsphingosine 1-beta-galactosyltransferase [Chionoecetes opilio]
MQVVTLCVLAAALAGQATGGLLPPERPYKILMLLPVASKSHRNVFLPLAEALADRGHKIVMLTNLPPASKNPNIMEINHDLPYMGDATQNMFDKGKKTGGLGDFQYMLPAIAKELYKVPAVKKLYDKRKEFDLIAVNHMFNEIAYPFVHEVPFITVATPGMDHRQSAVYGNVLNPSYAPNFMVTFPLPMSLWHRLKNTFMHLYIPFFWRTWAVVPAVQKEISAQFPDLPPLLELERNQSLTLMNTHFSIATPLPLLPSQVEVGAMHCRPAKPLPKDLESWLDGAGSAGVIYFSLGSITRGETMPPEYRQAFLEAFRRLSQRVLWKYEGELEGVSDNVRISSWLPQQDVLAHDSVKVFISHGGLLSLQESIFHATPLLVLPIYGDQPKNAMFVENSGLGRMLVWEELTADSIVDALTDIITKPNFFPVNTGVRQGCVLAPSLFNACMDWVLDKVVDQSDCGASVGNTKITDLVFADDAVIFAESLEVLVMALEALHEEAKPLGLAVSWLKTKVQVFGDLLDEAVQSVHACGEDIEILESFTYLGSAVHNDGGSRQEALRRIGIAHGVMDSLSGSIWRCRYLCRRTKIRIFKSLVIPVLLYGCETWTLNSDLKRRINAFGNKCLRRIMGYKENVAKMSASLKDQLTTPQERAVFWTEYVIRHRGAPQLRCPGAQISWVEFLMLDVMGLLLAALLLLVFILRRLVKTVSTLLFGNTAKTKKE